MSNSYNPLAYVADTAQAIDVNGRSYGWKDIDIKLLGSSVMYIQSINWDATQEKGFDVGAGTVGKFFSAGNKEYSGSMEIALSEFMKLAEAAAVVNPLGDPLDIPPFTINITYYSRLGAVKFTNLYNVAITDISHSATQGDLFLYHTLDFICTNVENL